MGSSSINRDEQTNILNHHLEMQLLRDTPQIRNRKRDLQAWRYGIFRGWSLASCAPKLIYLCFKTRSQIYFQIKNINESYTSTNMSTGKKRSPFSTNVGSTTSAKATESAWRRPAQNPALRCCPHPHWPRCPMIFSRGENKSTKTHQNARAKWS